MDEVTKAEDKKPDLKPEEQGWHLPGWVRELTKRVLYVIIPGMAISGAALWSDNIRHKENIGALMSRVTNMESRQDRFEAWKDKKDERDADKEREDEAFQDQVLDGMQKLLRLKR